MQLGIRYQTSYQYKEEVGFSPHEIRLFPRTNSFCRVRRLHFRTTPNSVVRFQHDVFDNQVAACEFSGSAPELHFELELDLDLEERNPFHFLLDRDAVTLPFLYDASLKKVLRPFLAHDYTERLNFPAWSMPTPNESRSTVSALVELNEALHESIVYERREEGPARTAVETIRLGRGACRDISILHAELLRRAGLAARLVSGYLRGTDEQTRHAEGSLHAWTEVFLPGAGWIGLDPTNGIFCNENFIAVAVGLTPADITPIGGSYYKNHAVAAEMSSRLEMIDL